MYPLLAPLLGTIWFYFILSMAMPIIVLNCICFNYYEILNGATKINILMLTIALVLRKKLENPKASLDLPYLRIKEQPKPKV